LSVAAGGAARAARAGASTEETPFARVSVNAPVWRCPGSVVGSAVDFAFEFHRAGLRHARVTGLGSNHGSGTTHGMRDVDRGRAGRTRASQPTNRTCAKHGDLNMISPGVSGGSTTQTSERVSTPSEIPGAVDGEQCRTPTIARQVAAANVHPSPQQRRHRSLAHVPPAREELTLRLSQIRPALKESDRLSAPPEN
jgi:hypothetical protein